MSVEKKNEKGKCPFTMFDPCNEKCVFYRKGIRHFDTPGMDPIAVEDCAINIIADNLESMHNRTYMMQKEVGETKNIMAMKTMVDLGLKVEDNRERLVRMIMNIVNPPKPKQIK
ncbi:MAG: hypothetical protein ACFFG0_00015 [Candidatus Thorarchaeota archaeon]